MDCPRNLQRHVPVAPYTTLGIGGPAEMLIEAESLGELVEVLRWLEGQRVPWLLISGGSNVLFDDAGFNGAVVINRCSELCYSPHGTVQVASGHKLDDLVRELAAAGWGGLEKLAGIPGSVGGAVFGNAGAYGACIGDFVEHALLWSPEQDLFLVDRDYFDFRYRQSRLKTERTVLLAVQLGSFYPAPAEDLLAAVEEIKRDRAEKHPGWDTPSAGSFFKNLEPEREGERRRAAGKYLDHIGAKQMCVGDAAVFPQHANIIINRGKATCAEVLQLAELLSKAVRLEFNIELEREVMLLPHDLFKPRL